MLKEKEWLLVYSELLHDAMMHFYSIKNQKNRLSSTSVENFEKTLADINHEHVKGIIELALLEIDNNKLYEFLQRVFVKPNIEIYKILEEDTLDTLEEYERSNDLQKKRIQLSAQLYSTTNEIYNYINELKTNENIKADSLILRNSKELDILKEQIQNLYKAFTYFEILEKQKYRIEYEGVDEYMSILDKIDIGKIKSNIAILQIDHDPSMIHSFLMRSININPDQIKRLKKLSDELINKTEIKYPKLEPRVRLANRLYKIYSEILHAVECVKSDEKTKDQKLLGNVDKINSQIKTIRTTHALTVLTTDINTTIKRNISLPPL
jgi:hypothetical protein